MSDIRHEDGTITRDGVRFGCHRDATDDAEIDGCVIDYGQPEDCLYGRYKTGAARKTQWTCDYWRQLLPKEAERRAKQEPTK